MKFLVTGGLGFIGSNFVKVILGKFKDSKVIVIDKITYASNKNLLNEFKNFSNFKFYKVDICDKEKLDKIFNKERFDYVINFAASTSVDKSFIYPDEFIKNNVLGAINLALLSTKYNVKRMHQVSTDEVYGDIDLDKDYSFKESDMLNPTNPYSISKAEADISLINYTKFSNLDLTISRSINNFGPYQSEDKLIPIIIKSAILNEKIPLFNNGKNKREWIYVLDHINAIINILFNAKKGSIYNIGSSNLYSNLDLTKLILNILNKDESLIDFNVKDRLIHDKKYKVDYSKIKKELGFKNDYEFNFALDQTLNYYKKRYNKYE